MPSYITTNIDRLKHYHYITEATTEGMWFNFSKNKLDKYVEDYGDDFCLVVNGSTEYDDAYILPFKEFKDLFTIENMKEEKFTKIKHRWSGTIDKHTQEIKLEPSNQRHEKAAFEYHNKFNLLQHAPQPFPKEVDLNEFI
jgi:hypothetical protein